MPAFRNSPFAVVLVFNLRKDEMRRNAEDTTLIYPPTTCGEPLPPPKDIALLLCNFDTRRRGNR